MRSHHLLALFRRPASARPALALRHRGVAVLSPLAFDSTTGISAPHTDHATKPSRKAKRFDLHHAIDHDIEQLLNLYAPVQETLNERERLRARLEERLGKAVPSRISFQDESLGLYAPDLGIAPLELLITLHDHLSYDHVAGTIETIRAIASDCLEANGLAIRDVRLYVYQSSVPIMISPRSLLDFVGAPELPKILSLLNIWAHRNNLAIDPYMLRKLLEEQVSQLPPPSTGKSQTGTLLHQCLRRMASAGDNQLQYPASHRVAVFNRKLTSAEIVQPSISTEIHDGPLLEDSYNSSSVPGLPLSLLPTAPMPTMGSSSKNSVVMNTAKALGTKFSVFALCAADNICPTALELHPDIQTHVEAYVERSRPSYDVLRARDQLIADLERKIQERHGVRFSVHRFGSTVFGVDTDESDLDLVLMDAEHPHGAHPVKFRQEHLPEPYNIRQLAKTVRSAGFGPVIPITAAVSIVKATHRASGLNIDLNVNERLGYFNTQMISKYMELSPVLRPLVYFLKYWAKSHNLDFLTSYCYTIMTVGFLQVEGVLPNLQLGYEPKTAFGDDVFWATNKSGTVRTFCDVRWQKEPPRNWQPKPLKLDEALYKWFKFWGRELDYAHMMFSIRHGRPMPRQDSFIKWSSLIAPRSNQLAPVPTFEALSVAEGLRQPKQAMQTVYPSDNNAPAHWKDEYLLLPDPFLVTKNLAGSAPITSVERLQSECHRSAHYLGLGLPVDTICGARKSSLFGR